jgi:hypothetical protein
MPGLLHAVDPSTGLCACPSCVLGMYMCQVYGTQQRANPTVMAELPSAVFSNAPLPPPPLRPLKLVSCPVHAAFGWCLYGRTCLLPHSAAVAPLVAPPATVAEAEALLAAKGQLHEDDVYNCGVCGFVGIPESCVTKVGEVYSYRFCPNCASPCYFPEVLYFVEALVDEVGDDYQRYKSVVERVRAAAPLLLKIPISYEAHRMATTIFAWTLLSPRDAKEALDTVYNLFPKFESVISLGCGTGYVEHVFNRVANGVGPVPHGPVGPEPSSFDGESCVFAPKKKIAFYAFDEILRPVRFSVQVCLGFPNVVNSIPCRTAVLLLSWPPFGSPHEEQSSMGFEVLRNYHNGGGAFVVYVGDVSSTGDWRFHEFLHTHYALVKGYKVRREVRRWHPQEMALIYAGSDSIGVYQRRPAPLPPQHWSWMRM